MSKKAISKVAIAKSNASASSQAKDDKQPPSGAAEAANPYSQALTPPPPRAPWHSAERNFDTQARSSTDPNPLFPLIEHQTADQLALTMLDHERNRPRIGDFADVENKNVVF